MQSEEIGDLVMRGEIAWVLAVQPEIMLFDEVTAVLDPETVSSFLTATAVAQRIVASAPS